MRRFFAVAILALASVMTLSVFVGADGLPLWAYGYVTPPPPPGAPAAAPAAPAAAPAAPDQTRYTLPGSEQTFTRAQYADGFNIGDWYPNDHPKMPPIVQYGKRPDVRACGLCHYPNGHGAEDPDRRRHVPRARGRQCWNRAARSAHHRDARRWSENRDSRRALAVCRVRPDRQRQKGRAARHKRRRENRSVQPLPRRGLD